MAALHHGWMDGWPAFARLYLFTCLRMAMSWAEQNIPGHSSEWTSGLGFKVSLPTSPARMRTSVGFERERESERERERELL